VLYLGECDENGHPMSSPVEVMSHFIDCIPDSAAEAEYVSVYDTTKRGVYCRNILEGIGYPQNTTEHECDNKCAVGIANKTVHDRKNKHIDRRYHWVKNEVKNGHFKVVWKEGVGNIADFFTKYLPQKEPKDGNTKNMQTYSPSNTLLAKRVRWEPRFSHKESVSGIVSHSGITSMHTTSDCEST